MASWAREASYPFEVCVQIEPTISTWFEHLTTDIVYFHSMLFASLSHTDQLSGREPSSLALLHFAKTLKFLQDRLSLPDSDLAIADPTITAITNLATVAVFTGDYVTAVNHMMGLSKIVELRGDLQELNKSYSRLPMKLCRCVASYYYIGARSSGVLTWKQDRPSRGPSLWEQAYLVSTTDIVEQLHVYARSDPRFTNREQYRRDLHGHQDDGRKAGQSLG